MNNAELFASVKTQAPGAREIPMPELAAGVPAHEGKPYRDSTLYVNVPADQWLNLAKSLKTAEKTSFDFLTMVTAVDYAKAAVTEAIRMDVVYHLFSFKHRHKLVVKVSVSRENASVPSVIGLWKTADWQEREVYDMYGIQFENHPNCTRILMWDGFPGWPLRKDFAHVPDRYDD